MANANDYPITTPFGYVAGYPLNNGFHQGIDYGCPLGTPVVVNGMTIGLSGATGAATGPHLHVGKFVGGQVQNPGSGGFSLVTPATCYDTGYDSINGNFIRLQDGTGAIWVYCHLSQINVTKGQVIRGGAVLTDDITKYLYGAYTGRDPNQGELDSWRGRDTNLLITTLVTSKEANERYAYVQQAIKALSTPTSVTKASVLKYIQDNLK